jgi:glutamate transport system substrate-binding protein
VADTLTAPVVTQWNRAGHRDRIGGRTGMASEAGAGAAGGGGLPAGDGSGRPAAARLSAVRLAVILAVLVLVLVVGSVVVVVAGPPSEDDLLRQAGLIGKRELLVGVRDDQPGVSLRDPRTGVFHGFDIDIGYMIAGDLGFRPSEVRFLPIQGEDRLRMRALDPRSGMFVSVDLVLAAYSITPAREAAGAHFSTAYLRTEQSVVTRTGHRPVRSLSDLADEKVCTLGTSTSADALTQAGIRNPSREIQDSACVAGLRSGRYDAVTTDAAILAGFVHQYPRELVHHDIGLDSEEDWGVNVGPNEALRTLVNLSLYRSWHNTGDRRWEDAFDRNLRAEQPDSPQQDVAVDQQPAVSKPAVRQWPWQR